MRTLQQDRRALANHGGEPNQRREDRDGEGGTGNGERYVEQGLQRGDHDGLLIFCCGRLVRRIDEQDSDDAE